MSSQKTAFKILTVEDTPSDVEILQVYLRKAGLENEMTVLRTAEEAWAYLEGHAEIVGAGEPPALRADRSGGKNLPHLIFIDLKLPGENGLSLLRKIKAHPTLKMIPVIVNSSSPDHEDLVASYRFGATYFLRKPCTETPLREVLAQLRTAGMLKG